MRTLDHETLLSDRVRAIDVSGIRRVFELGAKLTDPINLSIGQPDFPVPDPLKQATIRAIENNRNGYTLTQGAPELLRAVSRHLQDDLGWEAPFESAGLMITAGTSGAIHLAFMALLNPGDEAVIGDPYFVIYPALAEMAGARAVLCDTYPDFRMTADRIEPLITDRTKLVLINSPGNPSGVVLSGEEVREISELCESRGVLLVSDEIYDAFTYSDAVENGCCPSPARGTRGGARGPGARENVLVVRGFGKSYGCTGWRLGYAAGPAAIISQMAKLQQYTFVCAPSMAQVGMAGAFEVDLSEQVAAYQRRRDLVLEAFEGVTEVTRPGGAFYAFARVPARLGVTATRFAEQAVERNVLVIPGSVFSRRDTHVRLSYAVSEEKLREGLEILRAMMSG